jgi:hypothetical protein
MCEGWHVFHDMFPFFEALERKDKILFTDVCHEEKGTENGLGIYPFSEIGNFPRSNERAIIYISFPRHFLQQVRNGPLSFYKHTKVVRVFHGIVGPWANVLINQPDFLDVILAASKLDAGIWKQNSDYRVETVGWPKGELFLEKFKPECESDRKRLIIASNWAIEKAAFRICDYISQLSDYEITFTLHPHLLSRTQSWRRVNPDYVERKISKLKIPNVKVVECRHGILPHMRNKDLMLGVISSSSLEWLLFNRPIMFLREHPLLNFGPVIDFSESLEKQMNEAIQEDSRYHDRRLRLREMLMSHFDGQYANRFNELINQLERELLTQ